MQVEFSRLGPWTAKLLGVSCPATGPALTKAGDDYCRRWDLGLAELLSARNGFVAFLSSLHIFASGSVVGEPSLEEWNSPDLWRTSYCGMADNALFFAEDAFGNQFCLREDGVHRFERETGRFRRMGSDIEEWARVVMQDHRVETGWPLVEDWQQVNGGLEQGKRLLPVTPFVAGGAFEVENLAAIPWREVMRWGGDFANQIKDVPDGAKIRLVIVK